MKFLASISRIPLFLTFVTELTLMWLQTESRIISTKKMAVRVLFVDL